MSGRSSNWYSDHPPACTCAECARRGGHNRPVRYRKRRTRRRGRRRAPAGKFLVLIMPLVVIAGAVAYWQGSPDIGIDIEEVKQGLGGILPERGSALSRQSKDKDDSYR